MRHMVSAQDRGSSILRQGGSQNIQSEIVTSRTRAFLSCESGDMVVRVNFTQPFRGLMYAHRSRSSPCRIHGSGDMYYVLRIPLKGCGTWQESPRVFVNNITIRFHPALELEEDETKTLVCRYPPPLTPPPGSIHIVEQITPPPNDSTRVVRARLSEVEILIIICLLLFLSLLTLGIGIAYFCLKRRNIQLVRRKTLSSAPASQLTKLSSSTPQQPSLLSGAILGHTVRIPRAVPYSASLRTHTISDPPYEYGENPPSSPEISRDSLDSSPTTSTTSGDSAEATQQLLRYDLNEPGSTLTIPKAVLRTDDMKQRVLPSVHRHHFTSNVSVQSRRTGELEDQTVTTVLEPEYSDYGNHFEVRTRATSSTIPVYAQVDKRKQRVRIMEDAQVMNSDDQKRLHESKYSESNSGLSKRRMITHISSGVKSSDEVVTDKIITTTVKKTAEAVAQPTSLTTAKETLRTSPRSTDSELDEPPRKYSLYNDVERRTSVDGSNSEVPPGNGEQLSDIDTQSTSDNRNLCIRDISDVYVTTTIETESTEIRTTVSRDIIQEHVKDSKSSSHSEDDIKLSNEDHGTNDPIDQDFAPDVIKETAAADCTDDAVSKEQSSSDELIIMESDGSPCASKKSMPIVGLDDKINSPNPTDNWNVIIRQRKAPPSEPDITDTEDEMYQKPAPRFDVRIRTIPPESCSTQKEETALDRRDSTELFVVPQLKMPHSIEKIRGIIAQLEPLRTNTVLAEKDNASEEIDPKLPKLKGDAETATHQPKTVWWPENPDPLISIYSPEPIDIVSGSDSFRSETSLRERSSSEVLEKAPTLSTHRDSDNNGLERSTSEIVTARGHYNKWIKDVPVFESYSPDFLANIPVVTQGGFFHGSFSTEAKDKPEDKDETKTEVWDV